MVDPFLVGRIQTLALAETRIKFEYIDEFCNLLRVERTGLRIAKQQKKLRRLLKSSSIAQLAPSRIGADTIGP